MQFPVRGLLLSALPLLLAGGAATARAFTRGESVSAPRVEHATSARRPATFTFVGGGDIALTGDPDPSVFAGIKRFLRGKDLVVGNLEGTLATGGMPKCSNSASGCFTFRGSPRWAATLRAAGFTVLNVANNHALDFGPEAQRETLEALDRSRIRYQGLPGQIEYVRAGRVQVALIGCAPYRWSQSLLDVAGTAQLVHNAVQAADVVVVYMHAGAEGTDAQHVSGVAETYLGEPRGNPREFAHAMVRAGADVVFGSGPHVLRGIEWYRKRVIAYSLGNLAATHTLSTSGSLANSALLRITLNSTGGFVKGSVVPLRLVGAGTPVFDAAGSSIVRMRALSREDFGVRSVRLSSSGRLVPRRARVTRRATR